MTGPRFRKPRAKQSTHYVNNRMLYEAMCGHHGAVTVYREGGAGGDDPRVSEYVGGCILLICQRLSLRPNFIGYTFRDEMVGDGIANCVAAINNFNPEKSSNPFAYFTQIAFNAFIRRIQQEENQTYAKLKNYERLQLAHDQESYQEGDDARSGAPTSSIDVDRFISEFERKMGRSKRRGSRKRVDKLARR